MSTINTGCNHRLSMPPTTESASEACGLGTVKAGMDVIAIGLACKSCAFSQHPIQHVGDEPEAPAAGASAPSVVDAGFVPVSGGLPLEPIMTPAEVRGQETPPAVDSFAKRTADVKALLEEVPDEEASLLVDDKPPRETFEESLAKGCSWWSPGGSLMGWSKLKDAKLCLRSFFYKHVLGLERKSTDALFSAEPDPKKISARDLGVLVHAAVENFYRHGDVVSMMEPIEAVKGPYPQLALEARRLCNFYLRRFNDIEVREWDVRCVERESRYYFPARKAAGKRRRCCITSRLDGCYRQMRPGEGRLEPGSRAQDNLRIHELKTVQYIGGRLRGFFQKAQLLQQLLTFNHGHLVSKNGDVLAKSLNEIVGETWSITVTHLGKAMKQDPNKDIERTTFSIPEERVFRYRDSIGDWYYEEVVDRLFSSKRDDPLTWPMSWLCEDVHWTGWNCPFIPLCEADEADVADMFDQHEDRRLDPASLEMPAKLAKLAKEKTATIADNK